MKIRDAGWPLIALASLRASGTRTPMNSSSATVGVNLL